LIRATEDGLEMPFMVPSPVSQLSPSPGGWPAMH
jgi:hypothetical protein